MPLRKYGHVAEMPEPWHDRDDPQLWPTIAAVWRRSTLLMPRVCPAPGLRRFPSIDASQKASEEWTRARVAAVQRQRHVG